MCAHLLDINRLLLLRHLSPFILDFSVEVVLSKVRKLVRDLGPELGPALLGVRQQGGEARLEVLHVRHPRLELSDPLHLRFSPLLRVSFESESPSLLLRERNVALTRSLAWTLLFIPRRPEDR